MSIGTVIRIIECIVTIYCGVVLAVRPSYLRWEHPVAKVIFWVLIGAGMAFECVNTLYFKFSSMYTLMLAIYLFFVLFIFYYISFWKLLIRNFFYWYLIMLCRFLVICLCCLLDSVAFPQYINSVYGEPWHWIHVMSMFATIGIVLFAVFKKKNKPFIVCYSKKDYIWIILLLLCEEIINQVIFSEKNLSGEVSGNYLLLSGLALWSLLSGISIFLIYRMYLFSSKKEQMSEMSLNMLQKQYGLLQEMYKQKRMQVHDSVHHDILVMEYLQEGQYEEALQYLKEKIKKTKSEGRNRYTGLDIIDLILRYKIEEAKKYDIRVNVDLDVFFCPLTDTEMCVVLGNLMDNAIEAVRELPKEKRWIKVFMKTPNSIFLLNIKNPYEGKRKKVEGRYLTTKPDKNTHGVGMSSVERVIGKYHSSLDVEDDGKTFKAMIII